MLPGQSVCYKFTTDAEKSFAVIDNALFIGKICVFLNKKLPDSRQAIGIFWANVGQFWETRDKKETFIGALSNDHASEIYETPWNNSKQTENFSKVRIILRTMPQSEIMSHIKLEQNEESVDQSVDEGSDDNLVGN